MSNNKYQTREEKLRNKIAEELTHQKPSIDSLVGFVNEFETANLDTINKLNRVKKADDNKIKGALKQTINAHGPITMELIGSATKRINGALLMTERYNCPEVPKENPWAIRGIILGVIIANAINAIIYFLS